MHNMDTSLQGAVFNHYFVKNMNLSFVLIDINIYLLTIKWENSKIQQDER